jgi:hypothetical protein
VDSKAPSLILGLLIADFSIWMVRIGEVALASPYEAARRQSAGDLIVGCQVLLCWMAGYVHPCTAAHSFTQPRTHQRPFCTVRRERR